PRALRQLGVNAEQLLAEKRGKVWLRLMAYGDEENRIGFGDDIGVAAGLCSAMEQSWGAPVFVGDAIADPISGMMGTLAAWAKWRNGKGCLIKLSMRDAVCWAMQQENGQMDRPQIAAEWQELAEADRQDLYPKRQNLGTVEEMGASTGRVLAELC
ncbi:MAG: CoA transferase, partial [Marinomonas sp.]